MMHPDVSIIIPNFNCLEFLPACFLCIQKQSIENYEVIVVDDGSSDGSLDYLREQVTKWPQLRLLQQNRGGPGAARNLAAQSAKAPLLAFLDADDWWQDDKLARQIAFHQQNQKVVLSFTDYQHIDEATGNAVIRCFDYWHEFKEYLKATPNRHEEFECLPYAQAMLIAENVIGTSSVVVSKAAFMAVQGFDTSLPSASDWDLWLKISKIGDVGFSRACDMFYLQRAGSVSSNYAKRFNAVDTILKRYQQDVEMQWPQKVRTAKAARAIARHEMFHGQKQHFNALLSSMFALWLRPSKKLLKVALRDVLAATIR